jgi:hypothetical protein
MFLFYVWCNDGTDCFNIAVCKTSKEADATRGMAAGMEPEKNFFITREKKEAA